MTDIQARMVVLVPSRSRPQNIPAIFDAWSATQSWGHADLCFLLDQDDPKIEEYLDAIAVEPEAQRIVYPEWHPLVPKLNRAAKQAARDYQIVVFMGDDHLPRTFGWCCRIDETMQPGVPRIAYGRDGLQDIALPTWWATSAEVITRLGKMVPAPVQHLYCDNAVKILGERAGILTYLPEVLVEHVHPITGKIEWDEQYKRVNRPRQYEIDRGLFVNWLESPEFPAQIQALLTSAP